MEYTILIAEDDKDIAEILTLYLESNEYSVMVVQDGESALEIIKNEQIDLVILDVMMPKIDGFTLTKYIRQNKDIPILILTAKIEDNDKILGLNLGADDYLTKPFNPLEVVARVNAHLRRAYKLSGNHTNLSLLAVGDLTLDTEQMLVKKNGTEIVLTPIEYKILLLLMKSPGRVYTKSQICEAVNGEFYENYENAIIVHISHLRDKIEDNPKEPIYIKNIRGLGYKIDKTK